MNTVEQLIFCGLLGFAAGLCATFVLDAWKARAMDNEAAVCQDEPDSRAYMARLPGEAHTTESCIHAMRYGSPRWVPELSHPLKPNIYDQFDRERTGFHFPILKSSFLEHFFVIGNSEERPGNKICTFRIFSVLVGAVHGERANEYQAQRKVDQGEVSGLRVTTQPQWSDLGISLVGFVVGLIGLLLILRNGVLRYIGILSVLCGVSVAFYGSAIWIWLAYPTMNP